MKEKSNYWDTQFTDLSQFLMAIQKLAEKKQETLQENKNKKAIENLTEPVKPLKKQRKKKKKKKKTSEAKTSRLGFSDMDTYMSEEEFQKRKEKREKRKRREARKKRREGRKKWVGVIGYFVQ